MRRSRRALPDRRRRRVGRRRLRARPDARAQGLRGRHRGRRADRRPARPRQPRHHAVGDLHRAGNRLGRQDRGAAQGRRHPVQGRQLPVRGDRPRGGDGRARRLREGHRARGNRPHPRHAPGRRRTCPSWCTKAWWRWSSTARPTTSRASATRIRRCPKPCTKPRWRSTSARSTRRTDVRMAVSTARAWRNAAVLAPTLRRRSPMADTQPHPQRLRHRALGGDLSRDGKRAPRRALQRSLRTPPRRRTRPGDRRSTASRCRDELADGRAHRGDGRHRAAPACAPARRPC